MLITRAPMAEPTLGPAPAPAQPLLVEPVPAEQVPAVTAPPPPASRPRLSQTLTLGQGTEWQYAPVASDAPRPVAPQAAPPSVVNNVYVNGMPQYPYYGGYGY